MVATTEPLLLLSTCTLSLAALETYMLSADAVACPYAAGTAMINMIEKTATHKIAAVPLLPLEPIAFPL
jgi:hypothetical protein